jgi:autotransporter translocation and assembly factor TamB
MADIALALQRVNSPDMGRKLAPADANVTLTLKDRKLAANAEIMLKPLQTLRAVASVPLDAEKLLQNPRTLESTPLDVSVTLPDSDLNALRPFVEGIAGMKGVLGLKAKVTGTLAQPHITGDLHASAPAILFKEADMPAARDVKLRLRFDGTRVFIQEAGALLAGGAVGARGSVDWSDPANPKLDAVLTAREALVLRDESISLRANGDVTCRGSLRKASVTGKVELVRGRVFKEIEFLPLSLPNQLPPAPPAVTVSREGPPQLPPPFDQWNFNVDITTRDPVRLMGNVLNGGVVSDLHLRGAGARLVLEGKASLKDARVRLPFSRMSLSRGEVIFSRDRPFDPQLDVQGDSFVNGYQVTLHAYGRALDPKLRFSSSPPLPEGEIATLLATGATSGDLKSGEGEAANRAAFLVISNMYRKLFRKGARARESDEPPRLSFSFSPLNSSSGTGRSFSAVYEINQHLQFTGAMSQRGSFRGLLYYLIRFR